MFLENKREGDRMDDGWYIACPECGHLDKGKSWKVKDETNLEVDDDGFVDSPQQIIPVVEYIHSCGFEFDSDEHGPDEFLIKVENGEIVEIGDYYKYNSIEDLILVAKKNNLKIDYSKLGLKVEDELNEERAESPKDTKKTKGGEFVEKNEIVETQEKPLEQANFEKKKYERNTKGEWSKAFKEMENFLFKNWVITKHVEANNENGKSHYITLKMPEYTPISQYLYPQLAKMKFAYDRKRRQFWKSFENEEDVKKSISYINDLINKFYKDIAIEIMEKHTLPVERSEYLLNKSQETVDGIREKKNKTKNNSTKEKPKRKRIEYIDKTDEPPLTAKDFEYP